MLLVRNLLKTLRALSITNLILSLFSFIFTIVAISYWVKSSHDPFQAVASSFILGIGKTIVTGIASLVIFINSIVAAVKAKKLKDKDDRHGKIRVIWVLVVVFLVVFGLLGIIPVAGQFISLVLSIFCLVVYIYTIIYTTKNIKYETQREQVIN